MDTSCPQQEKWRRKAWSFSQESRAFPDNPDRLLETSLSLYYLAISRTQLNMLRPFARIRVPPVVKLKGNVDTEEVISGVCSAPLSDLCSEHLFTFLYSQHWMKQRKKTRVITHSQILLLLYRFHKPYYFFWSLPLCTSYLSNLP